MESLRASVIIPTYNRKKNLLRLLDSLINQSAALETYEVIVVDDGSPESSQVLQDTSYPFPFRCLRQVNQGSAAARNFGAENAQGGLLIFLDDDMTVEPAFISGLIEEHQEYADIIGMGSLRPHISQGGSRFIQVYAFDQELLKQQVYPVDETHSQREGEWVSYQDCVTNNLSVRREDFFKIGGMQNVAGDGPTWWGDIDFGYRAMLKGYRFRRSARAFCTHNDESVHDLASAAARQYKSSVLAVPLFQKFPELQDQLAMFQDMRPIDWKVDSGKRIIRKLVRVVASTWTSIRILTGIVWIIEKLYPSPALLRPLYRWILGGYVFQGYREGLRKYGQATPIHSVFMA